MRRKERIQYNLSKPKFAVVGLGFISDRHIQAINELNGSVYLVCDIDQEKAYKGNGAHFFKSFSSLVENPLYRSKIQYLSICTPNYLHYEMIMSGLDNNKIVICEKPPILTKEQYDNILKHKYYNNLNIVLQCRYSKELQELAEKYIKSNKTHTVKMHIEVYRDEWYMNSWKADEKKSGGLLFNIGVHYFDILGWFFGNFKSRVIKVNTPRRVEGVLRLDHADIEFTVAIDAQIDKQKRIFVIDDRHINLSQMGFESLHGKVYKEILDDNGFKLKDFDRTLNIITQIKN